MASRRLRWRSLSTVAVAVTLCAVTSQLRPLPVAAAQAPTPTLWGIDSCSSAQSVVPSTRQNMGNPQFMGRYLGANRCGTPGLSSPEVVQYLAAQGVAVLLISDPDGFGSGNPGGASEAQTAIQEALTLGAPSGTAIFRDVERSDTITAAYIESWFQAFVDSGSGYVPGFYDNSYGGPFTCGGVNNSQPCPSDPSGVGAYCQAEAAVPAIASDVALWSNEFEPDYGDGTKPTEATAPAWDPAGGDPEPLPCANTTVAWQYEERGGMPGGTPNVDVDEFLSTDTVLLWGGSGSNLPPTVLYSRLGDFSGDGKSDLAGITHVGTQVLASSGPSLSAWPSAWSNTPFYGTQATLAGDVTSDGKADLVAVDNGSTWVMTSTGSGFSAPTPWSSTPFYGSQATLLADVNGDGKADLVAVDASSTWVMLSTGSGFSAPQPWSSIAFYGSQATLGADVTGDGKADLVAVDNSSTWVMTSTGSGFSAPQIWSGSAFYGSQATLAADVSGDGKADLVAVDSSSTWVMVSSGSGFSAPTPWSSTPFYGSVATLAGDVTGDGKADLVAVNLGNIWTMPSTGSSFSAPQRW